MVAILDKYPTLVQIYPSVHQIIVSQQAFTWSKSTIETPEQCVMYEICSKLKTTERHHWRRSVVFIVNFEQISHIILVFPLLTLNKQMPAGLL